MATRTAFETPPQDGALLGWSSWAVLAAWLALVAAGLNQGAFVPPPGGAPVALLAAVLGPPAIFLLAYTGSTAFRGFVLALDLRFLTAVQCWRVLGGVFIAMHAHALLPALFAYPAGYGDVLVGGFALVALMALLRGAPGRRARLVALNVLGLVDFAGAVGTGLLASSGPLGLLAGEISTAPLQQYPLNLIPTFAVPLWIIIHVASLLKLRRLGAARTTRVVAHA
jgi:hypothetical protein